MSLKGNKLFVYLAICFSMVACSNKTAADKYVQLKYDNYRNIYILINDSINLYINSFLKEYAHIYKQAWQIDSLVCINSTKDALFTTINNSNGKGLGGVSDEITGLLGKKINGYWYFFEGGGTLIVPRDMYGKDEMHPLSFHELSVIARKEMFGENAIIKKNGEYVVNDAWVERHFEYNGICSHCKTHKQFDSTHWQKITDKWKHKIDTVEFKKL